MKTIYTDTERTLTLDDNGYLTAQGKKGKKSADLTRAFCEKALPTGVPDVLRKNGENPANWYILREGKPGMSNPVVALPDASREVVEAAILEAHTMQKERLAVEAAAQKIKDDAARLACPSGFVLARRNWSNGDLCAAEYQTEDGVKILASDLLESHNGWYYLPADQIETERAKQQAEATKKAEAKAAVESTRIAKFAEAKTTGKPIVLRTWMTEDCTEHLHDCSFDSAVELALPNGETKIEYAHCF